MFLFFSMFCVLWGIDGLVDNCRQDEIESGNYVEKSAGKAKFHGKRCFPPFMQKRSVNSGIASAAEYVSEQA